MATKYYDKILKYQREREQQGDKPGLPDFDFQKLDTKGFAKFTGRLTEQLMPLILWVFRIFMPVANFGGFYWITKKKDVEAALNEPLILNVPYGLEMRELSLFNNVKADFVLGLDGPAQARQNGIIRQIVLNSDVAVLSEWSAEYAQALLEGGEGRLDIITDLAIRVPTEICRRYFGLEFSDPVGFAEWSMSVSTLLFADPGGEWAKREQAIAGAARLNRIIDIAIQRESANQASFPAPADQTLVQRLIVLGNTQHDLKQPEMRAILLGLIVGFIPTNGLAGGKMLEVLVGRRDAFEMARKAALAGNFGQMERIVLEAGRINPALAPGQWRYAASDYTVRGKKIPKGSTVMVSTMSGLHDTRAPFRFDPDRQQQPDLIFGHATHRCIGRYVAVGVITPIFMELFKQKNLRRASGKFGKMQRVGFLPYRLDMEYHSASATQTMIIACIPIEKPHVAEEIRTMLDALHNPARPDVAATLERTGIVHYASCSVVAAGEKEDEAPTLIIEINIDGPRGEGIDTVANHCEKWLSPIVEAARPSDKRELAAILRSYCIDLHAWPWGTTGLNFFGMGGLSVSKVAKQEQLRKAAEDSVAAYLKKHGADSVGLRARSMLVMTAVRRELRSMPELGAFLVQPSRKTNEMSQWRASADGSSPISKVLRSGFVVWLIVTFIATWLLLGLLTHMTFNRGDAAVTDWVAQLGRFGVSAIVGLVAAALLWGLSLWGLWSAFLAAEKKEAIDERLAEPDRLADIVKRENAPGFLQNHIIAVTPLKRGLLRRLALALGLWGIRQSLNWFRPGFVVTMGTIHFAKWFRMPGSRKLIFQSNYDGSWESYLEDFVTRAHPGQTAAWSNGEGFPRSSGLINDGAKDGDRFKRWVRRQQIPTLFWYSRFPRLTAKEQRANALVHDGLARAQSDTAARSWLDLLGSAQRQPHELESTEIQSLIFRGLSKARVTACIPLRLPETQENVGEWLRNVVPRISFGKFPDECSAEYLAFAAEGIRKIGKLGDAYREEINLLAGFHGAFETGMGSRGAILGDPKAGPSDGRLWTDVQGADGTRTADAVLLLYAKDSDALDTVVNEHVDLLTGLGGKIVHDVIKTVVLDPKGDIAGAGQKTSYEPFGFRDGISSPLIRGAEKFVSDSYERESVEPGEFILGYRNNQGYIAPAIMVPASSDIAENLPVAPDQIAFGFADFNGKDGLFANRDFGRNGAFLAIRQLAQDVKGFRDFTERTAGDLQKAYCPSRLRDTVGYNVDSEWVAAKMMGRWRSGEPLIGNPRPPTLLGDERPDNDFLYGRDDPRGHACPLGAHIRRANPRDSLEPGDPLEEMISRRHLMLRRGRAYVRDKSSGKYATDAIPANAEKGLLFMAICADLERQFELVMQTWLGFPSFHGLTDEPDPISTGRNVQGSHRFTIPTSAGPLVVKNMDSFVDFRGGGYFFLPSRSALNYLRSLSMAPETGLPIRAAAVQT